MPQKKSFDQKEFLKSRESFLRKVSVCTLTDLNPGFDGPWEDMNTFCKWHFYNASKEVFWQKKFEFHARVQKCHFGRMEKLPKWHF